MTWRDDAYLTNLRRTVAEAQALLERLENRPPEPNHDLVVIQYRFGNPEFVSGKIYTYAALRVDGRWYLTGKHPIRSFSWDEMWDHFDKSGSVLTMEPCVRDDNPEVRYIR